MVVVVVVHGKAYEAVVHANASRSGLDYEGRLRHQAQWNEADKQALAEIYRPGLGPVPGNHGPMETRSRRAAATTFLPILAPSRILLSPCFFFFLPLFIFFLWLSMG